MKVKCKQLIILLSLILPLLTILYIFPVNLENEDIDSKQLNEQMRNEKNPKKPKVSGFWNVGFIHIKNDNWSATDLPWIQNRTGSWDDPHIIENVTINGLNKTTCIFIENCNEHFIIRNCTVYNSSYSAMAPFDSGIRLTSVKNAILFDNNCSYNNTHGIHLNNCDNITLSKNIANNNKWHGIELILSVNITCSENTANHNKGSGIYSVSIINNTINGNIAKNNTYSGLYLSQLWESDAFENIAMDNTEYGINLNTDSQNNTIYNNVFIGNKQGHAIEEISTKNNRWDNGIIGNYWDNYTEKGGYDNNNDGIGDINYTIYDSLGIPIANDTLPIYENPIHNGEKIHIDDAGVSALNWSQTALVKWWCNGKGTESDPYFIRDLIINGSGTGSGITIGNSSVNSRIENCTIFNSTGTGFPGMDAGIKLFNVNNSVIIRNNCSDNDYGILLTKCYDNVIHNNSIFKKLEGPGNRYGIYLVNCSRNNITNNLIYDTVGNSFGGGIILQQSNYSFILNNIVFNHRVGISIVLTGIHNYFSENVIYNNSIGLVISGEDNTAYNNTVKFNKAEGGIYISGNNNTIIMNKVHNNTCGIWITEGYNHTVIYNTVSNNTWGIALRPDLPMFPLSEIYENDIINNTLKFNEYGIEINGANLTLITMNCVKNNSKIGLFITKSGSSILNLIYNNSFIGNEIHAIDNGTTNYWNSSIIGNYWDNYTGLDELAPFGLGDTPYYISGTAGSKDYLPIIKDGSVTPTPEPPPPPPDGDDDDDDDNGKDEFDILAFFTSPTGLAIIGGSVVVVIIIIIIKIKGSGKSRLKEIERIEKLRSE